jgi:hypothetical protein
MGRGRERTATTFDSFSGVGDPYGGNSSGSSSLECGDERMCFDDGPVEMKLLSGYINDIFFA